MASEAKEVIVSHGKVLEPTGEKRMPLNGEFYREHDGVRQAGHDFSNNTWPIYREIKINEMANRLSDAEQRAEEAERKLKGLEVLLENPGDAEIARVLRDRNARVDKLDDELDEIKRQLATERASHANMAAEFELIAAGKHPRYWTLEKGDVLFRLTGERRKVKFGDFCTILNQFRCWHHDIASECEHPIYRRIEAPADATSGEPTCPKCGSNRRVAMPAISTREGDKNLRCHCGHEYEYSAPAPPAEEGELDVWKYRVFSMDIRLDSGGRRVAKFRKPDDADKFHEWLKGLRGQAIDAQNWHARIRELEAEVGRLKEELGEWNRPEIALIYSAPTTAGKFVIRWASSAIDRLDADDKAKLAEWADRLRERIHEMTTPAQAAKPEMGKEASPDGEAPSSANSSPGETAPKPGNVTSTGTEGVTSRRDETLVPVFVKTTDGQPMTEENARELSEYLEAELANDRTTPFTKLLKAARLGDGYGLRAFAERIGMLPSDFAKIQNGRVEPTDDDVAKIISGLSPTTSPHVETGGQEPNDAVDLFKYRVFSMDMRQNPVGRRIAKFETPGDADAFHEWLQELRDELINRREQAASQADQQDGKERV